MELERRRTRELEDAVSAFEDLDAEVLRDAGSLMAADQSDAFEADIAWDEEAMTRDSIVMTARDFGLGADDLRKYVHRAQSAHLVRTAASDLTQMSQQFTGWLTRIYTTLEDATQAYEQAVSSPVGDILFKTEKWRQNMYISAEWQDQQLFMIHAREKDSILDRLKAWWRKVTGKPALDPELNVTVIGPRGAALTVRQFHEQYRRSADDDAKPRDRAFRASREELYAAVDHDVVRGLATSTELAAG